MIFLHDIRAAGKRNEGMMFAVKLHAMDIPDVQLKDIFEPMVLYSNAPGFEREDNKNRLLGWVNDR